MMSQEQTENEKKESVIFDHIESIDPIRWDHKDGEFTYYINDGNDFISGEYVLITREYVCIGTDKYTHYLYPAPLRQRELYAKLLKHYERKKQEDRDYRIEKLFRKYQK